MSRKCLRPSRTTDLKAEGPLPIEIETEVQHYLENRRSALTQELATVATLAESDMLPDVGLSEGGLKITPLRAATPVLCLPLSGEVPVASRVGWCYQVAALPRLMHLSGRKDMPIAVQVSLQAEDLAPEWGPPSFRVPKKHPAQIVPTST